MPLKSRGFATDVYVYGIAESRVPDDQPAPVHPAHNATSPRINFLSPSRYITESDIPVLFREADAIELQFTVGEPYIQNSPLSHTLHATWVRYACINITCDHFEHQTAAQRHFSDEQLYRLDIVRLRLVSNRSV